MRILVGTLHTIENEFDECVAAIQRQTHQDFEHFVIEGLPKREAHDQLYGTFMAHASEFDLFMKVDADMVIENNLLFTKIVGKFRRNLQMDQLTIGVYDFFTDTLIEGLHTYRSKIRWPLRDSLVFTDKHPVPKERKVLDLTELAPAAYHCKNPSPFQAFHYGFHRGVKAWTIIKERSTYPTLYMRQIDAVWQRFLLMNDIRFGLAALGAELALQGDFKPEHISYTNSFAKETFQRRFADWSSPRIARTAQILRIRNRLYMFLLDRGPLKRKFRKTIPQWMRPYLRALVR